MSVKRVYETGKATFSFVRTAWQFLGEEITHGEDIFLVLVGAETGTDFAGSGG